MPEIADWYWEAYLRPNTGLASLYDRIHDMPRPSELKIHRVHKQLEPPRRPPSWYPGQPEPQKPRRRPCTCFYGLRKVSSAPGPYECVLRPGIRRAEWYTRCFVIVFDCPHHGDARYDPELLKGFTPAGEALFWETLDETERHD